MKTPSTIMLALVSLSVVISTDAVVAQSLIRIHETKCVELPPEIEELLARNYGDYHIPTARDYQLFETPSNTKYYAKLKDEVRRFKEYTFDNPEREDLPFVCEGDFNGDGREDVALLLLRNSSLNPNSSKLDSAEILVCIEAIDDGYKGHIINAGHKQLHFGTYVYTKEAGKSLTVKGKGYAVAPDDPMPEYVELDHEAIVYGHEGKAASLVYWEDNQFKQVLISD